MAPELQYLDGVNPLLDLTHQLSHDPTPPPVISVSHASSKAGFDSIPLEGFDIDAALLSLQGVTVFAAAGDSGVHDADAAITGRLCGYSPLWPASSLLAPQRVSSCWPR
mmetsp:Transcript_19247/g.43052  ORF Transcript_19247/g.43052 Transcript_19247/m.43052 type:complete len:109 (-) Transcript_19247:1974-2300(-)